MQDFKPQVFTVLGWNVADISSVIKSLNKKGIVCEKYPFLEQDDLGVWTSPGGSKVAWFKDPDGNVLSLTEYRINIFNTTRTGLHPVLVYNALSGLKENSCKEIFYSTVQRSYSNVLSLTE